VVTIARAGLSPAPVGERAAKHSMLNYLLLGLVAVFLLAGLIAIGVGNKRWNWGTVAAAILTLLTACGFLVLAARMAAYEWSWRRVVEAKQTRLAEVEDGLVPRGPGGRLVPAEGMASLRSLRDEQTRWQRAYDRIDSWRGSRWEHCSFQPPVVEGEPADGTVELNLAPAPAADAGGGPDAPPPEESPPPDGAGDAAPKPAAGKPPLDVGATVYLFDERTTADGGRYLGAMTVKAVELGAAGKTCTLTVAPTETPDAYDRAVWSEAYDKSVTVYDRLPSDRWLAFSQTPQDDDGSGVMPPVKPRSLDDVEKMIAALDAGGELAREIKEHDLRVVPKEEWPAVRERLDGKQALPGEYWARVRLTKAVDTLGAGLDDEEARAELPEGAEIDFDLQTAFELQDQGLCTIEEVRYRRPLRDSGTLLHGGLVEGSREADDARAIPVAGLAGMVESIRREKAILEVWLERLQKAKESIAIEAQATSARKQAYAEDLQQWMRDADEAGKLAAAFQAELGRSEAQRRAVNADVIRLARELRAAMGALVARIDGIAPPPTQGAAAAP